MIQINNHPNKFKYSQSKFGELGNESHYKRSKGTLKQFIKIINGMLPCA